MLVTPKLERGNSQIPEIVGTHIQSSGYGGPQELGLGVNGHAGGVTGFRFFRRRDCAQTTRSCPDCEMGKRNAAHQPTEAKKLDLCLESS